MKTAIKTISAPEKVADYEGKFVISEFAIKTSLAKLPAGTIFKITSAGILKRMESMPCKCCGISLYVTTKEPRKQFERNFQFIDLNEKH